MTTPIRNNKAPFRWMIGLIVFWIILNWLWFRIYVFGQADFRQFPTSYFVIVIITLIFLIVEAILYYRLRKKKMRRLWVRMHIVLLYFAMFGTNLLYAAWILIYYYAGIMDNYGQYLSKALNVKMGLYYASLIVAHIFFIMTLIKGFSRKPLEEDVPEGESGILDDFRPVQ